MVESVAEGRGKNFREKKSVDGIAERKESVTWMTWVDDGKPQRMVLLSRGVCTGLGAGSTMMAGNTFLLM